MAYPEYQKIMSDFPCGILLNEVNIEGLVASIHTLEEHPEKWQQMSAACQEAARHFTWEHESEKLLQYYHTLWREIKLSFQIWIKFAGKIKQEGVFHRCFLKRFESTGSTSMAGFHIGM